MTRPRRSRAGAAILGVLIPGALALTTMPIGAVAGTRPLKPGDIFALKEVADPRISPDGRFVAYEVTSLDEARDESDSDIWLEPLAGGDAIRLTASPQVETSPRFSPDGRYLAFLSDRDGTWAQVWLMDRRGGEAVRLTDYEADVSWLAWSPDSGRLALVVRDVEPATRDATDQVASDAKEKSPKPIVIR